MSTVTPDGPENGKKSRDLEPNRASRSAGIGAVVLAGALLVGAGLHANSNKSSADTGQPDRSGQDDEQQRGSIITYGTVPMEPEEGDGYRKLVLREASASGLRVTEDELDDLVDYAERLNPGPYGQPGAPQPLQPRVGEQLNIPNLVGEEGVDTTPPVDFYDNPKLSDFEPDPNIDVVFGAGGSSD